MFVGRTEEMRQLANALNRESVAVMIYGKRKIGKTTLIKECLKEQDRPFVYYECLKGTMKDNVTAFTEVLVRAGILPAMVSFDSFLNTFAFLNARSEPLTVVIDEYPYLKKMTDGAFVDSMFQSIIDNHLSHIRLMISGSHIGMMKEMLEEGNALYGRFHTVIRLSEFPYTVASAFYPSLSAYDKIAFYSVFGGSPYILQQLNPKEPLRDNIIRTILDENNAVHLYASNLLLSDYSNTLNVERIFAALGNGKKRYSELENLLDANKTGNLSKQLSKLTALEIIAKNTPFNRAGDSKKATYEINDNLMRFYFTYIYRNRSALQMLGAESFYAEYVEPSLTEFISRRFEELCRVFFSLKARAGKLKGIRNIGSYYYDDPKARTNGEFDVVLDYGESVAVYEVKYLKQPMKLDEIHHEVNQIEKIPGLQIDRIGFISANGFAEKEAGYSYLTGEDLYTV